MRTIILTLSLFMIVASSAYAQVFNTNLGFGYNAMVENSGFPSINIGVEAAGSSRWSVSGDFSYGSISNGTFGSVLVDQNRYTFETNANFYFNRVLQGFFLSGGGFYGADRINPVGAESIPNSARRNQHAGMQFGFGFSQQFSSNLNMSLVSRIGNNFYRGDDSRLYLGFRMGYNWLD